MVLEGECHRVECHVEVKAFLRVPSGILFEMR